MFDFDKFINKPAMGIFGRDVIYRPKNPSNKPFTIPGDFHESYTEINLQNAEPDISSISPVLFVRLSDYPPEYPNPLAGDFLSVDEQYYQIINIEPHIPGSKKLILHQE